MSEHQERDVDYRFLLANERTFLAWIRTSLAIIAGGVALNEFVQVQRVQGLVSTIAIVTIALGALVALVGAAHWRATDHAMRAGLPIKSPVALVVLGVALALIAAGLAIVIALA